MSDQETQHLINMANEIALNLSPGKSEQEAQQAVANHLQRFWPQAMQKQLSVAMSKDDGQLNKIARLALKTILV